MRQPNSDSSAYLDPDWNGKLYGYCNCDCNGDVYPYSHGDIYADPYTDTDRDSYLYGNSYGDRDSHRYSDTDCDRKRDANANSCAGWVCLFGRLLDEPPRSVVHGNHPAWMHHLYAATGHRDHAPQLEPG